jgi:mannose-P-dolichol utilization defect protein 1
LLGCLARVFTTATETGDVTLWWSFVSASILNGIIALQMFYYWNSTDSKVSQKGERVANQISDKVQEKKKREEAAQIHSALPAKMPVGATPAKPVQLQQQSQPDVLSPTRSGLRSAGRAPSARYTRKVD